MKLLALLLLLSATCFASGAKYSFDDPRLNDEFENVYYRIDSTLKGNVRVTSMTVNGSALVNYQASTQCVNTATFSTASGSYQTTNLTCKITPSSASSRIRILVSGGISTGGAGQPVASVFRDSTDLDYASSGFITTGGLAASATVPGGTAFIDSPATVSQVTYSVKLKSSNGATTVSWGAGLMQTMILEEIK